MRPPQSESFPDLRLHHLFWLSIDVVNPPVLFRTQGVVGIAFPIFIEGLEEENRDLGFLRPGFHLLIVAGLGLLIGTLPKLGSNSGPPGFGNDGS